MSQPFLGQIILFAFNFPPRRFARCDGQLLSIAQNNALFALLGTVYGGDGQTTFGLPDLRGRVPIGFGAGPSLTNYAIGQKSGVETVTLNSTNLPAHTHSLNASTQVATSRVSNGRMLATDTSTNAEYYAPPGQVTAMDPNAITATGGNAPHENRQPYLTANFCIALQGIFPSRN